MDWKVDHVQPRPGAWDRLDKTLFGGLIILNIIDAGQTVDMIRHHPTYYEQNPLLGKHPREEEVYIFKVAVTGIAYVIADSMTPGNRKLFLGFADAIVLTAVNHNRTIGLHVKF